MMKYLIYKVQIIDQAAYDACDFDKALKTTDVEIFECETTLEAITRCKYHSGLCPGSSVYNSNPELASRTPITFYYKPIDSNYQQFIKQLPHVDSSGQTALNL
jgi:hypothetical protein